MSMLKFVESVAKGSPRRWLLGLGVSAGALVAASVAQAATIDLTFEGINKTYPSGYAFIQNFYNGGTSSDGTSGTNFGISFSSNAQAICLNSTSVSCSNTSRGGLGDPNSQKGALFFLSGSQTFMDVAAGFTTGFSFNYVSLNQPGSVSVFSGLDGTGTNLGTIALSPNAGSCPGYGAQFCPFSPIGVAFAGTAMSVSFAGVANQIVFDDVTFGSVTPGVPEPSTWAMLMLGLAGLGLAGYRRAKTDISVAA
jgi:PEP-CTERM motif